MPVGWLVDNKEVTQGEAEGTPPVAQRREVGSRYCREAAGDDLGVLKTQGGYAAGRHGARGKLVVRGDGPARGNRETKTEAQREIIRHLLSGGWIADAL